MELRTNIRATSLVSLAALVLAGCGSTVKLDETPVETRTPTAVNAGGSGGAGPAARPGTSSGTTPQSQVATVNLPGAAGGAGGAGAATLGRVVYFDFDSFVVRDEYRALIDSHARVLAAQRAKRLVIEGHTDERGGREYNLALGQKRAEAVAKSLALLGASEAQIEAVSFGKERPVSEGHDEAAWAKNRRAELKDR
ncbi:MAG: peptidoglycan-associated lipoprotein [Burkholderiales bacterium RIFCSPHIGHO2_12_FULL_69_20]|nr:MAG: peptidoglycan-associated lipoprotein [Burkholderiales bacterium RIFCSPHIGHO2_12_FULL_69_20]